MAGLRAALCRLQARVGLAPFLNDVVAPLNVAVGDAWLHGDSAAVGRAPLHRDPAGAAAPGHRCRAAPAGADRAACPADHLPPDRRAVLRNYPVIGHLRFLLEYVRPRSASTSSKATTKPRRSRARSARWCTSAPRATRQAPLRHPARRGRRGLRVDQPLDGAHHAGLARLPHHHRRRPPPAARSPTRQRVQHLGHELRRAQRQRHPGAQRRRQARAASRTTPARARSASTTACTAAT
jgi:hypothetical protein